MMKHLIAIACFSVAALCTQAQVTGNFIVNGDINTYYAVSFTDGGWNDNIPTEMTLARSNVHTDATWRGSLMTRVRFHVTNWGHASNFIDADIADHNNDPAAIKTFFGGWMDGTGRNGSGQMVMWLRGGGTTYFYHSNYAINPVVHDGQQNPASYHLDNMPEADGAIAPKTTPDAYVRASATNLSRDVQTMGSFSALGSGNNYLAAPLCIGVQNNYGYQLAVNGSAIFNKAVVKLYPNWPDYVFDSTYQLAPLAKVEKYIKDHHHLPEIPSAGSVEKTGIDVGANQAALLKKIEELTLYLIQVNETVKQQQEKISQLEKRLSKGTPTRAPYKARSTPH